MYQFSYAEVLDETPRGARERERQAIERSIELLEAAEKSGVRSREAIEAVLFVRRLWGVLIEDLADPENDLPQALRADLISIGLWIMREAEQIRLEKSANFKGHHRSVRSHPGRPAMTARAVAGTARPQLRSQQAGNHQHLEAIP